MSIYLQRSALIQPRTSLGKRFRQRLRVQTAVPSRSPDAARMSFTDPAKLAELQAFVEFCQEDPAVRLLQALTG